MDALSWMGVGIATMQVVALAVLIRWVLRADTEETEGGGFWWRRGGPLGPPPKRPRPPGGFRRRPPFQRCPAGASRAERHLRGVAPAGGVGGSIDALGD